MNSQGKFKRGRIAKYKQESRFNALSLLPLMMHLEYVNLACTAWLCRHIGRFTNGMQIVFRLAAWESSPSKEQSVLES